MTRTVFQSGAEKGHYHDTLGVDQTGGGEQTIRLLGPFTVTHASPGLTTTGITLASLTPGQIMLRAWVITTTAFTFEGEGSGINLAIWVGDTDDDFVTATDYPNAAQSNLAGGARRERTPTDYAVVIAESACDVYLGCIAPGGAPDVGSTKAYVLIAEPA